VGGQNVRSPGRNRNVFQAPGNPEAELHSSTSLSCEEVKAAKQWLDKCTTASSLILMEQNKRCSFKMCAEERVC